MKIELTEDEVREVGGSRYKPSKRFLFIWLGSFILIFVVGILLPKGTSSPSLLNGLILLLALCPFFGLYIILLKKQVAAGRRFLEEQKKLLERELIEKGQLRIVDVNGIHQKEV